MAGRNFRELLEAKRQEGKFLCVGLDTVLEKIPDAAQRGDTRRTLVAFNRRVVDATADIAGSMKLNSALYEAHGDEGWSALRESIAYIHESAPGMPVILDAKRGDIGNTNDGYIEAAFYNLRADAITVHPYMGRESLQPFLDRADKGIFVLCRTSNPGAGEFQDLKVNGSPIGLGASEPLYKIVAGRVVRDWNGNGNCGLVVGATYPEELREVRAIAPEMPILIPGIGLQNGDLAASVAAGKDARGAGFIIAASRSIIFASSGADYAAAARAKAQELHDAIKTAMIG